MESNKAKEIFTEKYFSNENVILWPILKESNRNIIQFHRKNRQNYFFIEKLLFRNCICQMWWHKVIVAFWKVIFESDFAVEPNSVQCRGLKTTANKRITYCI